MDTGPFEQGASAGNAIRILSKNNGFALFMRYKEAISLVVFNLERAVPADFRSRATVVKSRQRASLCNKKGCVFGLPPGKG
jgi:hypothetical protein